VDFAISDEERAFVDVVRAFRETHLTPHEHEFLCDGRLSLERRVELEQKARAQGLWSLEVPEDQGGQGISTLLSCLVLEELYRTPMMLELGGVPEPALDWCTPEQRAKYVEGVLDGSLRSCYAFTEPDAGSDLGALRTEAVPVEDGFVINGTKLFISHADRSDFIILFATTDRSLGTRGVTCFLVDKDTPGVTLSREIATMGDDWNPHEILFEDAHVPKSALLGQIGEGWKIANHQLSHGRLRIAAYQLGIARRCLDEAIAWSKTRITWGKPIASRQAVQFMVADSVVELEAAQLLVYRAAWLHDQNQASRTSDFAAKLYATEMAQRVSDRAMQILGGMGYARESVVQSYFRQVRLWRIGHGTNEIHRWMIARDVLGPEASA
jgi:acyl-CoA dehydrogenase